GTMAAVLLYFRADLWRIAVAFAGSLRGERWRSANPDARMGWFIILGTIPIGICGLLFQNVIDDELRTLYVIGGALILFSFVMLYAESRGRQKRELDEITMRDGLMIGAFQAIALIPGVSRSGATISAGLLMGFDRTAAARYSFLLSVPAVVLAGLFELRHIGEGGGAPAGATALATLLAFIFGYLSIAWLLRFVSSHSIGQFVGYRIVLGLAIIGLAAGNVIS
ncbi:MAG TPA: undecaprenyl-diphosphate phosphatase, partial [Solirubrobacteraceae bacterium]